MGLKALFKKAARLVGKIKLDFEDELAAHFTIEGDHGTYQVRIFKEDYTTKHSCDCIHMSKSQPTNLCSHKLACLVWLTEREKINKMEVKK